MADPNSQGRNAIGTMHEVKFPNMFPDYLLYSSINCNYCSSNKTGGFPKVRQTFSNIFAMHDGDIKDKI